MIDWLEKSPHYPKFFYKPRVDLYGWGACGALNEYDSLPKKLSTWVCGAQSFLPIPQDDPLWAPFSSSYFFRPKHLINEKLSPFPPLQLLRPASRSNSPSKETWTCLVEATKHLIDAGELSKAVLARRVTFTFEKEINPWDILRMLARRAQSVTLFAFQMEPGALFLGATPERLYTRIDRELQTEAVAGTRPLNVPDEELFRSQKDLSEFAIVKEGIRKALLPLSTNMEWNEFDILIKATAVKHFYNIMTAKLKEKVTDGDILSALHPTPAMGGAPRDRALKWIEQSEPFTRGLYSAPIGWADASGAEFAVGIRSALVVENRLHLFTGAGIVADSDPLSEWEEIEIKMRPFTNELSLAHH